MLAIKSIGAVDRSDSVALRSRRIDGDCLRYLLLFYFIVLVGLSEQDECHGLMWDFSMISLKKLLRLKASLPPLLQCLTADSLLASGGETAKTGEDPKKPPPAELCRSRASRQTRSRRLQTRWPEPYFFPTFMKTSFWFLEVGE